jgi:hypothetical protein
MTADLRGSAIVSSIGESGNGCIETEQNLEGSGAPVAEGWPWGNPAGKLTAAGHGRRLASRRWENS